MLKNVYYINLEHRVDRKEMVEAELKTLGWEYQRFNAIKHEDGRLGCSKSHLQVLEMAKEKDLEYVVIMEDDIHFTHPVLFKALLTQFFSYNIEYDVLLLAANLRPPVIPVAKNVFQVKKSWTAAGYIVKKHYYDTLISNYREGISLLEKYPSERGKYELDSYWMHLQATDKWFVMMPRTVTQRPSYSDIEKRDTNYSIVLLDKIRLS
jgi:glycosyl transferase family 25